MTSTALSRGESKLTAAAEWMTVEQPARSSRPRSSRARPSADTSAGDGEHPPGDQLVPCGAGFGAQAVEAVVAEDLAAHPVLGPPPARAHEQDHLAVRHAAQQPLHQRGPEEPGGAGDGDALAGQRLGDHPGLSSAGDCPVRATARPGAGVASVGVGLSRRGVLVQLIVEPTRFEVAIVQPGTHGDR